MTQLFVRLSRYFRSHPAVYWLSMVAIFVFFGYFAAQLHLEEDIDKLMPSSRNEDGTMKLAFANLKIKDKTFLLFEKSTGGKASTETTEMLSEVCDAFVDSLQRDSALIEDVFYRLSDDLVPDGIDYLMTHLPAYIDTSAYARFDTLLTREHFLRQMQQNREDMTGEFGEMFPELIQMDPMGMRNVLMSHLESFLSSGTGSYKTLEGHFFVPDSTVCLAFLTPRFSSTNTGQGSALFERLNTLITQFSSAYPDVRISYHGAPANGYYNSRQIKHDMTTTITGALVLVLLFLVFCFRRWDSVPLMLLPVAFGTLFGLSMMYWIKGQFSLLALGIGGIVLGVALSYALHVMTHYQYVEDVEQTLRDQVKPVWLGCLTTIGSFAGLIFIKTDLLQDFGLFAAFAIFGTTFFSLTWLPPLLGWRHAQRQNTDSTETTAEPFAFLLPVINYPFDRKKPLIAAIVVLMAVCIGAYFYGGTRFDADMHNLGYLEENTERSEQLLREKTYTGDKQQYFASRGNTMEEAVANFGALSQKLDSLQQLGLVKDYTNTNMVFVPLTVQQERIDAWNRYWTAERLSTVRKLIAETAPQAGLRPEAFETFFEAATAQYEPDALYAAGVIPQGYLSTLMEQSYGGDYLCFTSVRCKNDSVRSSESDYMRICNDVSKNPNLLVLDTYYYTTDTLLQMSSDFDVLQWLSMAFVFMVLLVSFRFNLWYTLLGFMPILLSWLIVLGAMVLCDVRFNLISIIISTFIFGIGVDYSIFVMTGLTDKNSRNLVYHKTAIFLSAFTLIVTVSSMLVASHPAIRSVGFSTLVGLFSAVVLAVVLQPAVFNRIRKGK